MKNKATKEKFSVFLAWVVTFSLTFALFPSLPMTFTLPVKAANDPVVISIIPAETTMSSAGGNNVITVEGTDLDLATVRVRAINSSDDVIVPAEAATGSATSQTETLVFPENESANNITLTVQVSLDGGDDWEDTPTAEVVVEGTGASVPETFTVTFDYIGFGIADLEVTVADGESLGNRFPTEPTINGYVFNEWNTAVDGSGTAFTAATVVDDDITVYAQWEIVMYNITYDLGGGTGTSANPATYTIAGNAFTLNNPTRAGFTFAGWLGTGLTAPTINVTIPQGSFGDRTYTAYWTTDTYTLTLDYDYDGKTETIENINHGTSMTLPTLSRPGYTFNGWYVNTTTTGSSFWMTILVDETQTLYARWTEDPTAEPNPDEFVPVTTITGVNINNMGKGGTRNLNNGATVYPSTATNKNIQWQIVAAGTTATGATINAITGVLITPNVGTVTVRANISGGTNGGSGMYTQDFTILVTESPALVTITFDPNFNQHHTGGTGTQSFTQAQFISGTTLTQADFPSTTRNETTTHTYTFLGYASGSNPGISVITTFLTVNDQTLYAQWRAELKSVPFEPCGPNCKGTADLCEKPCRPGGGPPPSDLDPVVPDNTDGGNTAAAVRDAIISGGGIGGAAGSVNNSGKTEINGHFENDTYIKHSGIPLVYIADKNFADFIEVRRNGRRLTRGTHYTAQSGSTIITLLPEYLDTLEAGEHELSVHFSGLVTANTSFTVANAEYDDVSTLAGIEENFDSIDN
ncbi:MAG: InlB B-repeat-containing protein [Oscillospiraceae bacterium]|nr:InlB B-repeat-containing protein [Oscillospiraceae bacterium]